MIKVGSFRWFVVVGFVGISAFWNLTQVSAAEFDLPVIVRIENNRVSKVEIDGSELKKVVAKPGAKVTIQRTDSRTLTVERWTRTFTWETSKKRGKKTIKTTHRRQAEKPWVIKWDQEISGTLQFGTPIPIRSTQSELMIRSFIGPTTGSNPDGRVLKAAFQVAKPNREVQRPSNVPADANSGELEVFAAVSDRAVIGHVRVTVEEATDSN